MLYFVEDETNIFSNHAKKEKLNSSDQRHGHEQRGPTGDLDAAELIGDKFKDRAQDADNCHHDSHRDTKSQRYLGKRKNPVDRKIDQRRWIIFRFSPLTK